MELYDEIVLAKIMGVMSDSVVELQCFQAIQKIKAVLEDDSLEDPECFQKIEEIICVLEGLGTKCGRRHDF